MTSIHETFAQRLKEHGHSLTRQRQLMFDLLLRHDPMTMNELYDRAHKQLDRASVYRTIALFEKLDIVQRIAIGWKYKIELSDAFSEHHHHLVCMRCHQIIPISENEIESLVAHLAKSRQFTPTGHQVEIQGICTDCQSRSDSHHK